MFLQSLASIIACLHVSLQAGDRLNLAHVSLCLSGFPPPWDSGRTIVLCIAVSPAPLLSFTASTCCVCFCVSAYSWKLGKLIPLFFFCVGPPPGSGYRKVVECVHNAAMWIFYRSGEMVPRGKASQIASGRGGNWTAGEEKGGASLGAASRGA